MKTAIVSRAALSAALATVKDVVERRSTIPVLANVRLICRDGVMLATGTDKDIETTVALPVGAADDGFAVTVPAHAVLDILKKAPAGDDLAIDAKDHDARPANDRGEVPTVGADAAFDFGGLRINMQGIAASEFPDMGMSPDVVTFDLPTPAFLDALAAVEFAISTEETRYYLCGIYMHVTEGGALRMVATDGHRLGRHDIAGAFPAFGGVIIPRKTVSHLMKVCGAKGAPESVRVMVNHAKVRFIVGNVTVVSKLIDGTFPDYNRVLPVANDKRATFNRAELIAGIKAVSTVSSERGRAIKWEAFANGIADVEWRFRLSVTNPDFGTAQYDVKATGDGNLPSLIIGTNAGYALDILDAIDSELVTFHWADSASPMVIAAGERFTCGTPAETLYVLMPMRV